MDGQRVSPGARGTDVSRMPTQRLWCRFGTSEIPGFSQGKLDGLKLSLKTGQPSPSAGFGVVPITGWGYSCTAA